MLFQNFEVKGNKFSNPSWPWGVFLSDFDVLMFMVVEWKHSEVPLRKQDEVTRLNLGDKHWEVLLLDYNIVSQFLINWIQIDVSPELQCKVTSIALGCDWSGGNDQTDVKFVCGCWNVLVAQKLQWWRISIALVRCHIV